MADYYPLLLRAVRNLPNNSAEARQAIFVRARDALERQLRNMSPRINDADVVQELLNLEDVIKRIEAELADTAPASASEAPAVAPAGSTVGSQQNASEPDRPALSEDAAKTLAREPEQKVPLNESPAARPDPIDPDKSGSETKARISPSLPSGSKQPLRPTIALAPGAQTSPAPRPEKEQATAPARMGAEPPIGPMQAGDDAASVSPRLRMPNADDGAKRKKRLGLFAAGGFLAIIAMGMVALANRESPDRYKQAAAPRELGQSAATDPAKREGRLNPDQPAAQPEIAPQRQVQSVPIRAPDVAPQTQAQQQASATQAQTPLPVVSRAFMILEVQGRTPNQSEGIVNWSFAPDPTSRTGERVIRALADFSSAGLSLDFSIAKAADASLNASHMVTVAFETKGELVPVREISAIEWREREGQIGTTLAGTLVPIQDNFFMIGLDRSEAGQTRNLDLLRNQRWMVFEFRLSNGRRGAFLIEKGSSGERAISEALTAWK